ncbi:MAG: 4-hydroxyphenylacetate decarboxylase small subunit [Candidatus Eremiobacteraeota bacterium]|nr:4-hydroxyphenylacetate decarboxylase small subunit [Candidatus Eremiobacteraeota bacterium]
MMKESAARHRDCRNFAPVDVIKGICHMTEETVSADEGSCPSCICLPRCRECLNYEEASAGLGKCAASVTGFFAYEEMAAVTCELYRHRDENF